MFNLDLRYLSIHGLAIFWKNTNIALVSYLCYITFYLFYEQPMKRNSQKQRTALSMITPQHISQQKFDAKMMQMLLSTAYQMIQTTDIYSDDHNVMDDYQQLQYAIDAIHTYLYDRKNSHLNEKDAQIFTNYLVQKMKGFQNVVDQINKGK